MTTSTNGSGPRTATRPAAPAGQPPLATASRVPPLRSRRRPALALTGVVLVVLGVLAAVSLVGSAGQRTPVLVLARDVPYAATITDDDLAVADVSVDPSVAVVVASARAGVVGQVAASDLREGSLLAPGDVTGAPPPRPGQVLVGVAVPADRMPAGGVAAGDRILVVDTPAPAADPPTSPPGTIAATVVRRGEPDLNGVTVLDVTVSPMDGPALAARSATGRIAIVVQPAGG